jgi:hypothetical protein
MKRAEYPQKMCREPVWGTAQAYNCELPIHSGPCASFSVPDTVERRDAWEEDHPGWEAEVGSSDIIV